MLMKVTTVDKISKEDVTIDTPYCYENVDIWTKNRHFES